MVECGNLRVGREFLDNTHLALLVIHRQLLLPDDVTMHGKMLSIREGHISGERYVFTTPSISYAGLDQYAPKTVGAQERRERICPHIANDALGWKKEHRSNSTPKPIEVSNKPLPFNSRVDVIPTIALPIAALVIDQIYKADCPVEEFLLDSLSRYHHFFDREAYGIALTPIGDITESSFIHEK
ncbi:hypothetical protein I4U23_015574 [Adineta vaga]|nr:hypothetical protein I4U23_015574 [Adineta vaga]